ncbi:amino acid adenylation domain-containing protein [Helicobacter sp. 11S02596-1]|uniref:amino acid adenylation domain-containing protein n=1 Tax=Helicobacter sp. 11S02596-1 TaxID=1476194 RepID=UPI000BDC6D5E|nr:amino acid adenylation domain-containing protein [Helicobacter sp. 11S02596-1]PAF45254.1 hypothetical protein BJI48_00990 [Helicobacter sp. 11S02596-1]
MKINLIEYLQETLQSAPDKIGIQDQHQAVSFRDFYTKSTYLSTHLIDTLSQYWSPPPAKVLTSLLPTIPSQTIAIFLPKSIEALISIAGILLSGNVYMPLDIKSPSQRLQAILQNIIPECIITDSTHKAKLEGIFPKEKILLVENLLKPATTIKTNFASRIDTDPAYIINTSGSTGVPKGVVVSHRSVIDYIEWILGEPRICPSVNDVIGNQSPFYFDNSVLDIYLCFFTGAKLVLIPEEKFIFPADLLEYLTAKQINYIFWVPSVLKNIAKNKLLPSFLPNLKTILFAGETMPTRTLNYWQKFYPQATFGNLYGPTEITVDCTFYIINRDFRDDETLPIGTSCRNAEVMLLDENLSPIILPETIGEICVRGGCLSLGYYNDLEKTNVAFIQNPLHSHYPEKIYKTGDLGYFNQRGEIVLVGRKDHQIKHNGYRIELGEIEKALADFEGIDELCVLYDEKNSAIELFYEAKKEISKAEIFSHLKEKIPKYMYPQTLICVQNMPLNANGKIDRIALKSLRENPTPITE